MPVLKVAVITGGHHFDVIQFQQLFRELPEIDAYPQHMADFVASVPEVRDQYDVLVFFAHLRGEIENLGLSPGHDDTFRSVLESLGNSTQGIVVLHHGLLAFPGWGIWNEIVGISDRSLREYSHDEVINCHVVDPAHPICAGLMDWTMKDETYVMNDADAGNHILLTTDHTRSMATLAWTHQHKLSRVFCLQSGHNPDTWKHDNFRTLLHQGINWCANTV
jgi:trehalose utilization protein